MKSNSGLLQSASGFGIVQVSGCTQCGSTIRPTQTVLTVILVSVSGCQEKYLWPGRAGMGGTTAGAWRNTGVSLILPSLTCCNHLSVIIVLPSVPSAPSVAKMGRAMDRFQFQRRLKLGKGEKRKSGSELPSVPS